MKVTEDTHIYLNTMKVTEDTHMYLNTIIKLLDLRIIVDFRKGWYGR